MGLRITGFVDNVLTRDMKSRVGKKIGMGETVTVVDWSIEEEEEEEALINSTDAKTKQAERRRCGGCRLMNPMMWHKVAAISGMAALGLGTYGSHMYHPKNSTYKQVWQTASLYHLAHTAALVGAPLTKHPHIFGGLLSAGIVLFSGTCYSVAYFEDRKYAWPAPIGGFAFIAAWASLLF